MGRERERGGIRSFPNQHGEHSGAPVHHYDFMIAKDDDAGAGHGNMYAVLPSSTNVDKFHTSMATPSVDRRVHFFYGHGGRESPLRISFKGS